MRQQQKPTENTFKYLNMKLTLLTFLICITHISFSQKKMNDLEKMNLKGDIISIKTIVDTVPRELKEGSDFKTLYKIIFYTFNENGYITEEKGIESYNVTYKTKNYYNTINQIFKSEKYSPDDLLVTDENYEYDSNGEINKIIQSSDTTLYRNELEIKGNTKTYTKFEFKEGKVEEKKDERIENENGRVIEDNYYENNKLFIKNLYSYNKKELLSRKTYYQYFKGKVYTVIEEYIYNENNDLIKFTRFNNKNKIIDEENNTYVYDIKGNWITKHSQTSLITTTARNIDYKK
jgi:hypothetical protein